MIPLLPARRRAEEFARVLDSRVAASDPAVQELLDTVVRIETLPEISPDAQFQSDLRARLVQAAATQLTPARPAPIITPRDPQSLRRRRRLVAAATSVIIVGGGAGVAQASQDALPGDMLYPIKRTIENAKLSFSGDRTEHGLALLERAGIRLSEADAVSRDEPITQHSLDAIETTLRDFAIDTTVAGQQIMAGYEESGDNGELADVQDFTTESHETLKGLGTRIPDELENTWRAAVDAVAALNHDVITACPSCGGALPQLDLQSASAPVKLPTLPADASPYYTQATGPTGGDAASKRGHTDRGGRLSGSGGQQTDVGQNTDDVTGPADPGQLPALPDLDGGSGETSNPPQDTDPKETGDGSLLGKVVGSGSSGGSNSTNEGTEAGTGDSSDDPVLKKLKDAVDKLLG